MEKYDDPGDDKQICQRSREGKNLDGEIGKLSKYFMIPPTYHRRTSLKRIDLNLRNKDFILCGLTADMCTQSSKCSLVIVC